MPIRTDPQAASGVTTEAARDADTIVSAPAPRRRVRARDLPGVFVRAARRTKADHGPNLAQAVAFNLFLAIPSGALIAVGVFGIVADEGSASRLLRHLEGIVPGSVIALMHQSLVKTTQNHGGSTVMIAVGAVLALWSLTGAVNTLMWALNIAHERDEKRGFVRVRLAAVAILACAGLALVTVFGLLVLGPQMSDWIGSALDQRTIVSWVWWTAQWPVLVVVLLFAFGGIYRFGPDRENARWRLFTAGSVTALAVWLAASGGFAWYVSNLGSYNKAWGSLAGVIVMLTWLWLSSLALVYGAEVDAEAERSRHPE
jgi:membrane protein